MRYRRLAVPRCAARGGTALFYPKYNRAGACARDARGRRTGGDVKLTDGSYAAVRSDDGGSCEHMHDRGRRRRAAVRGRAGT